MQIFYDFDNCKNINIDTSLLQIVADACIIQSKLKYKCCVNLHFISNEEIQKLNFETRNINKVTDVLSYPTVQYTNGKYANDEINVFLTSYDPDVNMYVLGDTFISYDQTKEQAIEYNHSFEREMAYLFTHSIFHLMGYDHISKSDYKDMREMEEKVLNSIGITRDNDGNISDETLVKLAEKAMEQSYSPYSHYPVGACILSEDGRLFQGCNIENSAFGTTMCAERTALFKAVSEGVHKFSKIAIVAKNSLPWPCGSCRQALFEFAPNIEIIVSHENAEIKKTTLNALLPNGFGPSSLK